MHENILIIYRITTETQIEITRRNVHFLSLAKLMLHVTVLAKILCVILHQLHWGLILMSIDVTLQNNKLISGFTVFRKIAIDCKIDILSYSIYLALF